MREGEPFGVHLDTPNSSNANNVRNVNSDGTLNNNNAYNGNNGVRPLRWKMRSSRHKPKAEYHHQRKVYHAAAIHNGGKYRIADAGAFRAAEGKGYTQRGIFMTDYEKIYSFENLYKAYRKARQGKRWKGAAATVEQSYKSWRGHAEKGNCYHLIRRTDHYYNRLFNSKEAEKCQKH